MSGRLSSILLGFALAGCDFVFPLEVGRPSLHPGCSGMRMIATDFSDNQFLPFWPYHYGTDPAMIVDVLGGALQLGMTVPGYAESFANRRFDLRDSSFSIKVEGFLGANSEARLDLFATNDLQFSLRISRRGNDLVMLRIEAGQEHEVARFTYSAVDHAYWQISKVGDDVIWSTSADGNVFVERARFPGLTYATWMMPGLRVSRDNRDTDEFAIRFDDVNGGVPTGDACTAFGLEDDFEDGAIGGLWMPTARPVEQGGKVSITIPGASSESDYLRSATFYDLREAEVAVEVIDPPTGPNITTELAIGTVDGSNARIRVNNGMLEAFKNGTDSIGSVGFNAASHRWWRLRAAAANLFVETSPDGLDWTVLGVTNAVTGLDRADVQFGIGGFPAGPATATFDNFNHLP